MCPLLVEGFDPQLDCIDTLIKLLIELLIDEKEVSNFVLDTSLANQKERNKMLVPIKMIN